MPRPKKCRKVCALPANSAFLPIKGGAKKEPVILAVDEYETIRLIDKEGLSQEECGVYMKIARTSVQQIYASARKKVADALVDGLPLKIEGGDYQLCGGRDAACNFGGCRKRRGNFKMTKQKAVKENETMKLAVTYENGRIFQHFGHTEQFKIYGVENGKIAASEIVDTNGSGHGALAGFLKELGVELLVCGGIGGGAQMALRESGIRLCCGVTGDADSAVETLLAGDLVYSADATCDHHNDGGNGHNCGNHGCGAHRCGG